MKKVSKGKPSNLSTKMSTPARFVFAEYQAMNKLKAIKGDSVYFDILAEELTHWAENDEDALSMQQFYVKKKMLQAEFMRLCEKSETLKRAYAHALNCIGARRLMGAFKRKYDTGLVTRYQAMFDPDVKKHEEWAAKIRQQEEAVNTRQVIVIPDLDKLKDIK